MTIKSRIDDLAEDLSLLAVGLAREIFRLGKELFSFLWDMTVSLGEAIVDLFKRITNDTDYFIERLGEPATMRLSEDSLAKMGKKAMPALVDGISYSREFVRFAIARLILDISEKHGVKGSLVPKLIEYVKEGDGAALIFIVAALGNAPKEYANMIIPELRKYIESDLRTAVQWVDGEREYPSQMDSCALIALEKLGDAQAASIKKVIIDMDVCHGTRIGLEEVASIQRKYLCRIGGKRRPEEIEAKKQEFAAFYAKVAEELCNRKQDVPMEDTELARRARQRMKECAAARNRSKPRVFRKLGAVCG